MRALQSVHELSPVELPDLVPKDDEYLISIFAMGVNYFDNLQVQGKYQHQPPLPWIAGAEFSGAVIRSPRRSATVPKFSPGQRVFGFAQGSFSTMIAVTEDKIHPVPKGWSDKDAAGLAIAAPTSYAALVDRAGVKKDDWVLVHAAAGGVGLAAVQIAKAFGAKVIATAGSDHKLSIVRRFGADYVINYTTHPDWPTKVTALTGSHHGVDIVFDPVGLIYPSTRCIAWNGRLLTVGFGGGKIEEVPTNRFMLKNIALLGTHWGVYAKSDPAKAKDVWEGLFALIRNGSFRSTVFTARDFVGLETVPSAIEAIVNRSSWGKVVVQVCPNDVKIPKAGL